MAKEKKPAKKGAKGKGDEPNAVVMWTQRARGLGLLLGLAITFRISRSEGLPMSDAILRGLVGAIAMSLVCWWCALLVIQAVMRTTITQQQRAAIEAQIEADREHAEMMAEGS